MKLKSTLTSFMVAAFLVLIHSCSSDDTAPKQQFVINGETITLKGANLYLTGGSNCCNDHDYRDYFITDGEFVSGSGWSKSDYTNATYYLAVELAVPAANGFEPGEFPIYYSFSSAPAESNISYIWYENAANDETYFDCESPETSEHESVVVSGGFDDGETMTVKFTGKLRVYYYDGMNWVDEELTGKVYFKGEVNDVRPI